MNNIRRYISLLALILMGQALLLAQTIRVSAPSRVEGGENFRVAYTVNTQDVDGFRAGNFPSGLEVVAGPYTSSQSSFQMINGHTSSSSSITYTYTVFAAKDGTYTIPAAHAQVGGKRIASPSVKIVVSGSASSSQGQSRPRMHQDDGSGSGRQQMKTSGPITGNDLFIRVSANKKRLHEQEPVLLTYKVYTRVDLTQLEGKMPDLKGFHTQEVQLPQQKTFHTETINGRPYKCVTWSQYVMYPQMTGKLEIPSLTFHGIVVEQNRNVDPFEAFFNGGSGYVEVKKDITAPGMTIQVDPLPNKPAGFSGGVGRFNISASLSKKQVKAGDAVTLRVVVGGTGNLKLIKQPEVQFPKGFDKYDAKVTDKTRLTANGVEGNMVYDFLAVPRNQGDYEIPAVEFTYYDVQQSAYRTIKTQPFTLHVDKGDGKTSTADYADQQNQDIHGLKFGANDASSSADTFFGSTLYVFSLLLPFAVFVALLLIFRQRAIENADVVRMRSNRANKVASKRLKQAHQLMLQGRQSEFYDEVLRTLWGYVSDKLNMPVEQLSRDNIQSSLEAHDVDVATIGQFVTALDECEYERYAPGDAAGNMNKTFESAMVAIMKIEEVVNAARKSGRKGRGAMMGILLVLLLLPLSVGAVTKQNADAEYSKGNYQQAIRDYEDLLRQAPSAVLYYNLGNAYYRSDNITRAVLAYERAHKMAPGDEDIQFNLDFARSKTIDKITPESEMFFVIWYRSLVNAFAVDTWAFIAVASMVLVLLSVLLYLFAPVLPLRKAGFFGGMLFFVLFLLGNLFAWQQQSASYAHSGAIVVAPTVSVHETPSVTSSEVFVIHEGTRVDITDRTMDDWRQVHLADGRTGWLSTRQIEEI